MTLKSNQFEFFSTFVTQWHFLKNDASFQHTKEARHSEKYPIYLVWFIENLFSIPIPLFPFFFHSFWFNFFHFPLCALWVVNSWQAPDGIFAHEIVNFYSHPYFFDGPKKKLTDDQILSAWSIIHKFGRKYQFACFTRLKASSILIWNRGQIVHTIYFQRQIH